MVPISSLFLKQSYSETISSFYLSLFCFITLLIFTLSLKRRKNKLNLPPSPPKLPIIGNLHQLGTLSHRSLQTLSQKYGPLMILHLGKFPTLVVSSAEIVREIIKTHDVSFSNRPQTTAAKLFLYGCKDLGFAPYDEEWRQRRKTCVLELLSLKKVRSFRSIRKEANEELVVAIREACRASSAVNLSEMLVAASNNIVSRCVIGRKCDARDDFCVLVRKVTRLFECFSVGDFFPSFGWIDVVSGLISEMKVTFVALDDFFDEVIREHEEKRNSKSEYGGDDDDFIGILLQLQEYGKLDFELTRDTLKAILMDMIFGGTETSSATLEWAFAEILRNPNIMKKAQEEVRRVIGSNLNLDENDVNKMHYLKCVVKEILRLHPPAPLSIPRETTCSVKLKGYDIPPKTRVLFNVWAIQRDPELWNKPEEFIPERFENSQVDVKGQDFQLIPFGAGRRGCPGISFGLASVEYMLANLLYWFDWKVPEIGVQDIDMSETNGLTVSKKVPLLLEPIPYKFGCNTQTYS